MSLVQYHETCCAMGSSRSQLHLDFCSRMSSLEVARKPVTL
jgi:hypothetical protein